jgi:FixJ family two-component response regulator
MSDVQNAMREGVSNFLTKPVLPNKLIEAIENECKQIELDKQKFWDV